MLRFAQTCEAIAATTKKLQKTAIVAEYLKSRTIDEAAVSAVFLSGSAFAAWEETTLQIGGSLLWRVVAELSGKDEVSAHGGLSQAWGSGRGGRRSSAGALGQGLTILEVDEAFRQIAAARGSAAKAALVRDLLQRATPLEAKYIVKIMTGDLRIGLKESLVEEAIARAYDATLRGGAASEHATRRYWRDAAARRSRVSLRKQKCGCFILWDSCWPVRSSRPTRD